MKLTPKLILVFLLISILPILLISEIIFRTSRNVIEKEVVNHLVSTNLLKSTEIGQWVHQATAMLEFMAGQPHFRHGVLDVLQRQTSGDDKGADYQSIYRRILDDYLKPGISVGDFIELMIVNVADGRVIISNDSRQEGKIFWDQPFFQEGRQATFVQNIYYSMALRQPAMTIATPLKDDAGQPRAVLSGYVDLARLSAIMEQRTNQTGTEDTYLVNTFNFFVTEPRFETGAALKKSIHTLGVTKALARGEGVASYPDYRGKVVIGAYKWLPEWQLCILTEIDQTEAFASIATLKTTIVGATICFTLFVMLIGWLSAVAITTPVKQLVAATEAVGRGDLDFRLNLGGKHEIAFLARSFEKMTERLKSTLVSKDALIREIEERKQIESKLKKVLTDLKRSNNELEQFAYVASHDLQEPLRMVSSYTQLLAERYQDKLDEKAAKFIHYAVDGAARMQKLINDLLAFSRITTRGGAIEVVSSENVLDAALQNLRMMLQTTGAMVTHSQLPRVRADESQLTQVFQNLIGNAIKFRSGDMAHVHVAAARQNSHWLFSIKDNGIGIEDKYKKKIFVIFQRLHTRDEYPGTGIGLALCKRIVERHGGTIWFTSEPGRGTTFFFSLPTEKSKVNCEI